MKQIYFKIVDGQKEFENMADYLALTDLPENIRHVMTIQRYNASDMRTVKQNRLYWKWLTLIADFLGDSKADLHFTYKKMFLVKIFERDDEVFATMVNSIRKVYSTGEKKMAEGMHDFIVDNASTTKATSKQFTEYLKDIEQFSIHDHKFTLPHPDEYWIAMGIKQPVNNQ